MIFSKLCTTLTKTNRLGCVTTTVRVYSSQFDPLIMPRDLKIQLQQQHKQRNRSQLKGVKYAPTYAFLQVIGQGNLGEPRSVFLCTDQCNYLFNCGEGTQRLAAEHHGTLAKTENVFITRPTWNNIGGLPGVALSIQETGIQKLHLHGPEDSINMIETTKNFMNLNELKVITMSNALTFRDQIMTVNYVLIQKPCNRPVMEDNNILFGENIDFYAYQTKGRKRPHSSKSEVMKIKKNQSQTDDLVIFICKMTKKLGNLNIHKCIQLNVPSGPLLGKLKAGEDVTLDNGTVVKSKDVVGPSDEGSVFIVLECPDEDWIDLIVKNQAFSKYQNTNGERENVSCIVHFTPEKILNNSRYKKWMREFGSDTVHLVVNEENTGFASMSIYKLQHQLHLIHPTIFPIFFNNKKFNKPKILPKYSFNLNEENLGKISDCNKNETIENKDLDSNFLNEKLKVRRCKALDRFNLRPNNGLDTESNIKIDSNSFIQEAMEIDGFLDSLTDLQTEINAKTNALGGNIEEYPKLVMLGTGSSIPNKIRNTSAMLLQINEETSIVFDCAESTTNQIIKFFGETEAKRILKTIKAVYISHLHADHHLGLIGLLEHRKNVSKEPIILFAPHQIMGYLRYYSNNLNKILDNFKCISNRDLLTDHSIVPPAKRKEMLETLKVSNITTEFVMHCPFSYAVAITLKDGRKICYSGDTMPCDRLNNLARDSFLLIHEATIEDALERDAILKRHSTVSQAVHTGIKADANFILLTHFSHRNSKLPLLPETEQSGHDYTRVGIAYDFMSISLAKLTLLPLFYKTLEILFQRFKESIYQKAIKRKYSEQRLKDNL